MSRYIVVRADTVVRRVDITGCQWCSDEWICAVCHEKANALRAELAKRAQPTIAV